MPPSLALLAAFVLAGCGPSPDYDTARIFQDAEKTFSQAKSPEDFLKAAAMYQQILDRGQVCAAVLYNQGNAFMQAGQRGRAIAAYRQAQRYLARDSYLEANLTYALGNQPAAHRRPLIEHLLFWQDWISYPAKFSLAAGSVGITFLLAVAAVILRVPRVPRVALAGLAISLVLILSAAYDWYRYEGKIRGVIVQQHTVMRKGDAEGYEPALTAPLEEGAEFVLLERRGEWLRIQLAGDQEGWVPDRAAVVY